MKASTRRVFLQGAATAALGLPFLGRFARGGESATPRRVVIVWTPNDAEWPEQWGVTMSHGQALPAVLPAFLQPLEAFRDRVAVVGDLENVFGGGHGGIGHALTGVPWIGPDSDNMWGGGVSVDQHVAAFFGQPALTLGVACGAKNGKGRMSYTAAETPADPIEDPTIAFETLFADIDTDADELAARRARQHSILDRVAADLQAYEQQIPAVQRPRLQQHLQGIRDLEETIDNELLAGCDPTQPGMLDAQDNASVPAAMRGQLRIIAQALGCGATQVATLQLGRAGGGILTPDWPDEGIAIPMNVHTIAHEHYLQPDNAQMLADSKAIEAWYSAQIAFLLEQLAAIPDVDGGSLLDHTLVVHAKELGRRHALNPMTYVLAGGPDLLVGDRYWSMDGSTHNDLLLTLCQKMGLPDATFGDPAACTGVLPI